MGCTGAISALFLFFLVGGTKVHFVTPEIIIGQNYTFVFIDGTMENAEYVQDMLDSGKVSYEQAKTELAEKQGD